MSKKSMSLAVAVVACLAVSLAACQDQRDEFNPVNVLCPGDFDPVTQKCKISTGGDPE